MLLALLLRAKKDRIANLGKWKHCKKSQKRMMKMMQRIIKTQAKELTKIGQIANRFLDHFERLRIFTRSTRTDWRFCNLGTSQRALDCRFPGAGHSAGKFGLKNCGQLESKKIRNFCGLPGQTCETLNQRTNQTSQDRSVRSNGRSQAWYLEI